MATGVRHVVVAGSTGLIGRELVRQLARRDDVQVTALVRRAGGHDWPEGVTERVFSYAPPGDYGRLGTPELPCDVLLCAVGTTMKQAGSKEAFRATDRDVPLALAARLVALGPNAVFGFVSSVGAGRPTGFYLQTKAEVEQGLVAAGLRHVIVRPSFLLGQRDEVRVGERVATAVVKPLGGLLSLLTAKKVPAIGRLLPITAERVARTLIHFTVDHPPRVSRVIEGYDFL